MEMENALKQKNAPTSPKRRVFLYGVGVVAPGAQNLAEFVHLVKEGQSALSRKASLFNLQTMARGKAWAQALPFASRKKQ